MSGTDIAYAATRHTCHEEATCTDSTGQSLCAYAWYHIFHAMYDAHLDTCVSTEAAICCYMPTRILIGTRKL
eukprot:702508-Rhodomonas_salina.4